MKLENSKMKISMLAVSVLIVGLLCLYFYASRGYKQSDIATQSGQTYLFVQPAFAQSGQTTFLDEEAGMSIYVDVGRSIDLAVAKTVYRAVEKETSNYTVGSVPLPGLSENEDVHCFVHRDGWIVVYYLKGEPISKIVDWNLWSQTTSKLTKNNLQVGLDQMTNALGVVVTNVKYYHFQYPNANKCMIILETLVGKGEDSFNITMPNDLAVYERSWSHYSEHLYSGYGTTYHSYFNIDGNTINTISGVSAPVTNRGTLNVARLFLGVAHVVSVSSDYATSYLYGVGVALAYQEP